jgi:predicted phage replisome organizer
MAKKYVWLKLKEDFFKQKSIKKLRKMAGGAVYTLIYLKMQLASLKNEGKLYFEGVEDDFIAELSLDLDESVEDIQMTVLYLQKNNLIEFGELPDEYILPEVVGSIGSETAAAARMRKMRENKKLSLENKSNNVTPKLQYVTNSYTEEEEEKDEDNRGRYKKIEEEKRKLKISHLSSMDFTEKLSLLKNLILKATLSNEHQLSLVFRPLEYKTIIDELLFNIYESDYLQGKIAGKFPTLQTFTVKSQINRILAGFYKNHEEKIEKQGLETLTYQETNSLDDIL